MDEYEEEKISAPPPPPPPPAFQPVPSRYNDYAVLAPAHPTDCIPVIHRHANSTIKQFLDFWWLAVYGALCYQFIHSRQMHGQLLALVLRVGFKSRKANDSSDRWS